MNEIPDNESLDNWIKSSRGKKNQVDLHKPYAWMIEKELSANGKVEDVAVIFLTNKECPFKCIMCDLWRNTTDETVPAGSIPEQIETVLKDLPSVKHLKLYNSGSFFDTKAIPEVDHKRIASMLSDFETVIVESHPAFLNKKCLDFKKMLKPDLHVAMGLETANPEVLRNLNKKMTLGKFRDAVIFLTANCILSRAFILLRPPYMSEQEGIYWAEKSLIFAFEAGVECCTVIPVRPGNGAMEKLMDQGLFGLPQIRSLETVQEYGISLKAGRVFADTWDLGLFSECDKCLDSRIARITDMNLTQKIIPEIKCECGC
jgi:archaeosine synthase beta-subunit